MIGNLKHNAQNNRSGIKMDRFFFVPVEGVKGEDINGLVVLLAGYNFFEGECTRYSSIFNDNSVMDPNGPLISPEFLGVIPKIDSIKKQTLDSMDGRRFVLLFQDKMGAFWQCGGHQQGLKFSREKTTGEGVEGRNSAIIRFTASRMRKKILPYNKELILIPVADAGGEVTPPATVQPGFVRINGFVVGEVLPGQFYDITSPYTLNYQLQ